MKKYVFLSMIKKLLKRFRSRKIDSLLPGIDFKGDALYSSRLIFRELCGLHHARQKKSDSAEHRTYVVEDH